MSLSADRSKHLKCSPEKQNFSNSPQKSKHSIQYIGKILREAGVNLTKHGIQIVQSKKSPIKTKKSFQLKLKDCQNQQLPENKLEHQQIRQLQVKLNDYQFELKKTNEDFAQFKVLSRIQKDKETKKLKQKLEELKKQLNESNEAWQKKFIQKRRQFEEAIQMLRAAQDTKIQQKVCVYKQNKQKQIQSLKIEKEKQVESVRSQCSHKILLIQSEKNDKVNLAEKYAQKKINEISVKCQMEFNELQQRKNKQIKQLELNIAKLEEQNTKQKTNFDSVKDKLYHDLYQATKQITQLQAKNQTCNEVIQKLKQQLSKKKLEILQISASSKALQSINEEKHKQNIKDLQQQQLKKVKRIQLQYYQSIRDLEKKSEKMIQLKNAQTNKLQESLEEVSSKFYERPSKNEDIILIKQLQYRLMCEQEQNKKLREQIKRQTLENENREKNYNRIFSSSQKKTQRHSYNKELRQNRFTRHSNTQDMRCLLKLCTKNF